MTTLISIAAGMVKVHLLLILSFFFRLRFTMAPTEAGVKNSGLIAFGGQPQRRMKPALASAWQVIANPHSTMNADEVNGSQRVITRPSPWKRDMNWRA